MEEEDNEDSYSEENLGNFASEIDMLRGKTIKDDYPDVNFKCSVLKIYLKKK